jgi:uncharacterized protein (DUF3084 family)
MDDQALGIPVCKSTAVDDTLSAILACQGAFIEGEDLEFAYVTAVDNICRMLIDIKDQRKQDGEANGAMRANAGKTSEAVLEAHQASLNAKEQEIGHLKTIITEREKEISEKDREIAALKKKLGGTTTH